ncbi:Hypothetical predicted protein [Lecanosticta acicola]|uniref:GPI anchored protein n=1 Tax=Lecanosticta acicola TaxID=111012 RepID=A0AAI8YYI2_9PEZI|nr:Hypothetical predicted protein [Lecanosticta acicola]
MWNLTRLLLLPASLLVFAEELQWPHNLPRTARYFPEDESHVERNTAAQEKLAWQAPAGVKKMEGFDPGQKFWMEYWDFGERTGGNGTEVMRAAMRPHTNHDRSILARSLFGRDFKCPSDTNSCRNIGSNLCCGSGETCVSTGSGVGCCPDGASCGTSVSACDTNAGYTSCPNSNNGGCCIPGAQCLDTGCVLYGTRTVTTTLPAQTVTTGTINPTTTTSPRTTATGGAAGAGGTTVVVTSGYTTTVTLTPQGSTVTTTVISPTTIIIAGTGGASCSADFFSCPASLGGGCCRNGQDCVTKTQCADVTTTTTTTTTTTATAAPPVRPTSEAPTSDTPISPAGTQATTSVATGCPTGFYMCSAVYLGGCCQVDRDCHTTSCPPTATTSVITSGLTIAVGGATAACAQGWQTCAASNGGGCCPSGYVCGTSCTNTAGGGNQAKQTQGSAAMKGFAWSWTLLIFALMGSAVCW